jgi:hypothetical protein
MKELIRQCYDLISNSDLSYLPEPELKKMNSKRALCKKIEKLIDDWQPQPLQQKTVIRNQKKRVIYRSISLEDHFMNKLAAVYLEQQACPQYSKHLYSFQKGISFITPLHNLLQFLENYLERHPIKTTRKLYVVRADVASYYESIPTHNEAPIWKMIPNHPIITKALRNGIPTGQPICCPIANIYLSEIDAYFSSISDTFYARYSDDILFVAKEPEVVLEGLSQLQSKLKTLGLVLNEKKIHLYEWNGAGRAATQSPFEGTESFCFLGYNVHFSGKLSLPQKKMKRLLLLCKERLLATYQLLKPVADPMKKGALLCQALNQAITQDSPLAIDELKSLHYVTHSSQIHQINYLISLQIAKLMSGNRSVRAFRKYPPRTIRKEWGLNYL